MSEVTESIDILLPKGKCRLERWADVIDPKYNALIKLEGIEYSQFEDLVVNLPKTSRWFPAGGNHIGYALTEICKEEFHHTGFRVVGPNIPTYNPRPTA